MRAKETNHVLYWVRKTQSNEFCQAVNSKVIYKPLLRVLQSFSEYIWVITYKPFKSLDRKWHRITDSAVWLFWQTHSERLEQKWVQRTKTCFVFLFPSLSHHHCLSHLTGGLSPDGLGLQGAPLAARSVRSLHHRRLLSLCPGCPKEREAGWTQREMSKALQRSRSTGLKRTGNSRWHGKSERDDTNENWGVGSCALTAAFSTSISRKLRSLTHSPFSEVCWLASFHWAAPDSEALPFMFSTADSCWDCRPAVQCGNCGLLEMHERVLCTAECAYATICICVGVDIKQFPL